MVCANLAIVGGDDRAPPGPRQQRLAAVSAGDVAAFVRPCKKTIGLAECMLRNARPLQDLQRCALRDQRAGGQLPTLSVTPASRENAAARRLTGDDGKGASILLGDGIRVKHRARQDVGRYQWVLGRAARPRSAMSCRAGAPRDAAHLQGGSPGTRQRSRLDRVHRAAASPLVRIRAAPAGARRSASVQSAHGPLCPIASRRPAQPPRGHFRKQPQNGHHDRSWIACVSARPVASSSARCR